VKRKKMNTKMKQIALPIVVVIAVLLAFSSPAAANYSGDHPLTTYEQGLLTDGGLIFETVTDNTTYTKLYASSPNTMTQNIPITIPAGATVKTARLYNYYSWSKSDFGIKTMPGAPAEATISFTNPAPASNTLTKVCTHGLSTYIGAPNPINFTNGCIQYWDTKGQGYAAPGTTKYDYPSGTFACDVTNIITGSGTYVATITNADSTATPLEYFTTWGFGLLVVYEGCGQDIEYWIDEGCDVLLNTSQWGVYEPIATTNATFPGMITDVGNVTTAELTIVTMAPDKGYWSNWPASMNMNYFNGLATVDEIGPSVIDTSITNSKFRARTIGSSTLAGMVQYNVLPWLQPSSNTLHLQDRDLGTGRGDNTAVSNAFLVLKKPISADVTIKPETLNLNSKGKFTAFITLPDCYDVADIDVSTVKCECAPAIDGTAADDKMYVAKFDRKDLKACGVGPGDEVELTVTGELTDGTAFEGSDTIRVI
jgi:hypothetical protein